MAEIHVPESRTENFKPFCLSMWIVMLISICMPYFCSGIHLDDCGEALGMESGMIEDADINASSSHSVVSVGPQAARLNKEINSGAWCPSRQISKDVIEYLEISLNSVHVVTGVATQGRFGNGQGLEFAEEYMLEYWRPGLLKWLRYKNALGQEVIRGNSNTYTVAQRKMNPIVIASKIRFIPFSLHLQTVCMRVEVYGCSWNDGLISYSMLQGERRGSEIDLTDRTYDGTKDTYLQGGLGQLTDGVIGDDNFKLDISGMGRGYEWIGWKNDSHLSRPLEIIFEFNQVREFNAAYFYCNNMYTRDVQVFSSAKIWFSVGGRYFNGPPVDYSYMPDTFLEEARNIKIPLHQRMGRFVKLQLMFASKWMLLSEVSFSSVPATGNFTEEDPPIAPSVVSTAMSKDAGLTDEYVGLIIGVLAAVILILIIFILVIILRNKRRKYGSPHTIMKPTDNRAAINMKDLGLNSSPEIARTCLSNGTVNGHVIILDDEDPDKQLYQEPQDIRMTYHDTYCNASNISREYAVPEAINSTYSNLVVPLHSSSTLSNKPAFPKTLPKPLQSPFSNRCYTVTAVLNMPSLQGVSGNSVYATPNGNLLNKEKSPVCEILRHKIIFKQKIGQGQFGEVHLCEVEDTPQLVDIPCNGNKTLAAVKTLNRNASEQARSDFHREVKILARLRNPNIVHLVGVCTKDEPLCMIVEYMENGDLSEFLRKHVPESSGNAAYKTTLDDVLSHGSLIFIATQIASGMKYLENLNLIHRDLATRNCLVGRGFAIKIADFGMSRNLYSGDYYRIEGRAMLPIRWMAWESIFQGKFSTKSDVWAFAVTLWEILTFARQQPYSSWTDEKVIENAGHFCNDDGLQEYLSQPEGCPKEIYDLMKECWQRNNHDRPKFNDIHLFLMRKNLGYSPQL